MVQAYVSGDIPIECGPKYGTVLRNLYFRILKWPLNMGKTMEQMDIDIYKSHGNVICDPFMTPRLMSYMGFKKKVSLYEGYGFQGCWCASLVA